MYPIKFKEHNVVLGKDQEEYSDLPALVFDDAEGRVVTCWHFSFLERLKVLFGGRVWIQVFTFRQPFPPMLPTVKKTELFLPAPKPQESNELGQDLS